MLEAAMNQGNEVIARDPSDMVGRIPARDE
jgi:hypothetical protein